ncbi:MAG TPA: decaprenyl-phosphate phosphoribosyltransferase [Clostridiales bacterium]|nr:decaprenyl-phosphate phosphoribosyltransferase [Clostridiales bacterium]
MTRHKPPVNSLAALVRLTRPRQWLKNGLVGAAAVFSGTITDPVVVIRLSLGGAALCALSGAVYALNDLHDRATDRVHPLKRDRPLASGAVSAGAAWGLAAGLVATGLTVMAFVSTGAFVTSMLYLALNALYTLWAKEQVILDVLTVSAGFLLRVITGGFLAGVHLSPWLLACTFLLSLTLALGKRRGELNALNEEAVNHRKVMSDYSVLFLDQMIAVVGSVTITCYTLYTLLSESGRANPYLFASVIPVVYGLLRYFYLIYHRQAGESPETLPVTDRPLLAAICVWLAIVGAALYG